MDRAEAEAIYESGRVVCVELILSLAAGVERHEDRLRRLEEQARQDSRASLLGILVERGHRPTVPFPTWRTCRATRSRRSTPR